MAYFQLAWYVHAGDGSTTGWYAVAKWAASTAYAVGAIRRALTTPALGNERTFICTVAGTSGLTEPAWPTGSMGAKVTESGGPTWQECSGQPPVNGDAANTPDWWSVRVRGVALSLGMIIKNVAATHYFICDVAGNIGNVEPTWVTTAGSTTADNTCTWRCLGPISSFGATWAAPIVYTATAIGSNGWYSQASFGQRPPGWPALVFLADSSVENYGNAVYSLLPNNHSSPSDPLCLLSVDHLASMPPTDAALKAGAQIGGTNNTTLNIGNAATFSWGMYFYGVTFVSYGTSNNNLQFANGSFASVLRLDACTVKLAANSGNNTVYMGAASVTGAGSLLEWYNTNLNLGAVGQGLTFGITRFVWRGGTLQGVAPTWLIGGYAGAVDVMLEGLDLSLAGSGKGLYSWSSGPGASSPAGFNVEIKDCKVGSGFKFCDQMASGSGSGGRLEVSRCDSGAGAVISGRYGAAGSEITSTAVVRTGGTLDVVPVARKVVTANNTLPSWQTFPFKAITLAARNVMTGVPTSAKVYGIAADYRLPNNDEWWLELEYLGDGSSPLGTFQRGAKHSVLAAPGALAVDTSAWDSQAAARVSNNLYAVGDIIKLASNPGRLFFCTLNATAAASEPSSTTQTWNGADSNLAITLTNGSLTAAYTGAGNGGLRALGPARSAKCYFEITNGGAVSPNVIGACTRLVNLATAQSSGAGTFFVTPNNGNIAVGNVNIVANIGAASIGDVFCFALDLTANLGWIRRNGGSWNGNPNANPAAGVGGINIASLFAGLVPAYPMVTFNGNTAQTFTLNAGAAAFAQTKPTGYGDASLGVYSSAVDGDLITDGVATFIAMCRFSQQLTMNAPSPAQQGFLYGYPRIGGRPGMSMTYFHDPHLYLS